MPRVHTSASAYTYSANRAIAQQRTQHSHKQDRMSPQNSRRAAKAKKSRTAHQRRKALLASGVVAALIVAVAPPNQISSEAIAQFNCQQMTQSQAKISRDEISALLSIPAGSAKQRVRQAVLEPYCLLPVKPSRRREHRNMVKHIITEREAYPLAFDPSVWLILNYDLETYVGYDFVFNQ